MIVVCEFKMFELDVLQVLRVAVIGSVDMSM